MTTLPQVGKYETLEQIGTGGFGVVYKARDPHIQRLVAIKLCTSRDEDVRKRFLREAKIAGNLQHKSIVTLFDLGFSDHGPYLVQEYLTGEDLEAKIARREPMSLPRRLEILADIAAGLRHAHEQGVLHRDVKPANVRILDDDRVKILDFGIAKLFGAETQLTKKGTILGTAGYLAPEQISGKPVDLRTDVFAFGVLAYELLTYEHPFPGEKIRDVLRQVLEDDPPPVLSLEPDTPPPVSNLVGRCLAKSPDLRPAGFPEIEDALAPFLETTGTGTGTGTSPKASTSQAHPTDDPESGVEAHTVVLSDSASLSRSPSEPTADPRGEDTNLTPLPPPPPPTRPVSSTPDPGAAKPRRSRTPSGASSVAGSRPWLGIALAALVVLTLGAGWWWWGAADTEGERQASSEDAASEDREPSPEAGPEGRLLIEATPWGRVVSVTGADGEVEIPLDAVTPFVLAVPPGRYTAEVMHPEAETTGTCEAWVPDADLGQCRAEVLEMDALEYFREAGWWE